jgi:hypothetical protein
MRLAIVLALTGCLGGNGPDGEEKAAGHCKQLKECRCSADRPGKSPTCETEIDGYAAQPNGEQICLAFLAGGECGSPPSVNPSDVALGDGITGSPAPTLSPNCLELRDRCCPDIADKGQRDKCFQLAHMGNDALCNTEGNNLQAQTLCDLTN